jgi:hypothetical protein
MAGKAFCVIKRGARALAAYASHSGGETNPVMREVPLSNRPATMIREPSGGQEFVALELTFGEKRDEGIFLEDPLVDFQDWQNQRDDQGRSQREDMSIIWYGDNEFTREIGRHNLKKCYPEAIKFPEGERGSSDAREFSVTIAHQGSEYVKGQ